MSSINAQVRGAHTHETPVREVDGTQTRGARAHLPPYTVSVAPMMDCTDRHFRYLARLFSPSALLYTEMIAAAAIVRGNRRTLLDFHPREHPVALQIGSGDPELCARAVEIAEEYCYDEYNLNVGCPSPKVKKGVFGAQLMAYPHIVAEVVRAMKARTDRPVTIKQRLGINPYYRYEELRNFIEIAAAAAPDRIIVHARIALLDGLSPKANRSVPPIMYQEVYRLKREFPELTIEVNGEVAKIDAIKHHLGALDGVMLGREVYRNPRILLAIEREIFHNNLHSLNDDELMAALQEYIRQCREDNVPLPLYRICAHLSALYYRYRGAKKWRTTLHNAIATRAGSSDSYTILAQALHEAYHAVKSL